MNSIIEKKSSLYWLHSKLETVAILVFMALLSSFLGYSVAGQIGVIFGLAALVILCVTQLSIPYQWTAKLHQAQAVYRQQAQGLHFVLDQIVEKAQLEYRPKLFVSPSMVPNAMAFGHGRNASVLLTRGLIRLLPPRELSTVLAHEVAHIKNGDIKYMALAQGLLQITTNIARLTQFFLLLMIPFILFGMIQINLLPLLVLAFAPGLSTLLWLRLSRTREFEADRMASDFTGDPLSLAHALHRMETHLMGRRSNSIFDLLFPKKKVPHLEIPECLRTHPATKDRLHRLQQLSSEVTPSLRVPQELFNRQQTVQIVNPMGIIGKILGLSGWRVC